MGAKVQSKTYFPGSMTKVNNGFCNGVWDVYHDDKSRKISGPRNGQRFDYFLTTQAMDGCTGYEKEQIRQTILKHESIFRHQLQELHRLYKRQRDLMNQVPAETSKSGRFTFPLVDSTFSRAYTSGTNNTKSTLKEFGPLTSKCKFSERKVIDLELPADVDESMEKVVDFADLNEPIEVEETTFSASVSNKNDTDLVAEELRKRNSAKRTIFGVEIERNHTPSFGFLHTPAFQSSNPQSGSINPRSSFVLPSRNTQNSSNLDHNHWLFGDSMMENSGFFAGSSRLTTNSRSGNSSALSFLNGIDFKGSASDSIEEICGSKKRTFMNMWKNHETPEERIPSWLTAKPCLQSEQTKGKETMVHHINLDSLQNHSRRFFEKIDDTQSSITKILGVSIVGLQKLNDLDTKEYDFDPTVESHCESKDSIEENGRKNCSSDIRYQIDLNLSLDEEDDPSATPAFPETVEVPAVLESETDFQETFSDNASMDARVDLVKVAAEVIVSISSSNLVTIDDACHRSRQPSAATLLWFAEVITSPDVFKKRSVNVDEESVPEGMDYFEFMTLKLQDSEENYDNDKPLIMEDENEQDVGSLSKRMPRKGQGRRGRQRKDFRKDILPSIVTLSRREVTEDLQTFEEAFSATGVSWQSSLSKRKAAARNGRGRRQSVVANTASNPSPPPPAVVERTDCWKVALEKSLGGWGRRTRRLPRQRCPNSGNHHHSLALKC